MYQYERYYRTKSVFLLMLGGLTKKVRGWTIAPRPPVSDALIYEQ